MGSVHAMDSSTEASTNQWCTYGLNSPISIMKGKKLMRMPTLMGMTMFEFFLGGFPHTDNLNIKIQRDTG